MAASLDHPSFGKQLAHTNFAARIPVNHMLPHLVLMLPDLADGRLCTSLASRMFLPTSSVGIANLARNDFLGQQPFPGCAPLALIYFFVAVVLIACTCTRELRDQDGKFSMNIALCCAQFPVKFTRFLEDCLRRFLNLTGPELVYHSRCISSDGTVESCLFLCTDLVGIKTTAK